MSKAVKATITTVIIVAVVISGYVTFFYKKQEKYTGPIENLTIGSPHQEISSLVYLANEFKYFEENGLRVEIKEYDSGASAVQGLLEQHIDIALATDLAFVSSNFDNNELRILSSIARANVEELVARKDSGITKIVDLKGKKIGIKKKSSAEFHLSTLLLFNGISLDEVEVIDLYPSETVNALLNKEIDATVIWPPYAFNLKNELGKNAISWPAQSGQDFFWLALTTEGKILKKMTAFIKFLLCLSKAKQFIVENEIQAKQTIEKYLNLDETYIDYHWAKQNFVIELPESLVHRLEDEAKWRIDNRLTDKTAVPNYLKFFFTDPMEQVSPDTITLIH